MPIVVSCIEAFTTADTAQAREALRAACVRGATVRKGSGSIRFTLTVTAQPGHEAAIAAGRQTCCQECHTCGTELRPVLDGELWCPACNRYW